MDIYNWILSEEIREYLRENHSFSLDEKILIIHTAYRSLEEKYAAFQTLLGEAANQEDKDVLSQMCRLYDWAFEQLRQKTEQDQVFLYASPYHREPGDTDAGSSIRGIYHTYEELMDFLENDRFQLDGMDTSTAPCRADAAYNPDSIREMAWIEKWARVEGKMEWLGSFGVFKIEEHYCFRNFVFYQWGKIFKEFVLQMGISERLIRSVYDFVDCKNPLPLPFQHGDLVRLNLHCWWEPLYGVLCMWDDDYGGGEVYQAVIHDGQTQCGDDYGGRETNMFYMKDSHLVRIRLTGWNIDFETDMPVIHWLRHAEPSELPDDQKPLAELSSGLHRLAERDRKAAENIQMDWGNTRGGRGRRVQDVIDEIHSALENFLANERK